MYERLVPLLKNSWEVMVVSNPCPITAAAYLNIRADLFIILLQSGSKLNKDTILVTYSLIILCTGPAARDIHDARYIANQSSSQKALQTAEGPIMVLKDALERCLRLDLHVIDFTKNNGTYSFTKFLHNEAEILSVLDEARGSISDEETMAIFRKVPPSNLRMAIDLFCPAEWNPVASYPPRDPRQADFVLALRGYDLGAAYGRREDQKEVDTWICQLIMAGSERSVSPCG